MTLVRFFKADGTLDKEVEAAPGQRLLDVAWAASQPLEGACEGVMACSTCHVIVDAEDFEKLPAASEEEEDLLDLAAHATPDLAARLPDHPDRGHGEPERPDSARRDQLDGPLVPWRKRIADACIGCVFRSLPAPIGRERRAKRLQLRQGQPAGMRAVEEREAGDGRLPEFGRARSPVEVGVRGRNRFWDVEQAVARAALEPAAKRGARLPPTRPRAGGGFSTSPIWTGDFLARASSAT